MKRTPIVAGNWKMNKTAAEAVELVRALLPGLLAATGVECVLCPPFTSLAAVAAVLQDTPVGLGAQNMHWEEKGAYTGEVSAAMLSGVCQYVIIGHSERRQLFCETDETVNRKLRAAFAHGLIPIVCVGENLEQNEAGMTDEFVSYQVRAAFAGISQAEARRAVVAYEPVWAIGTGKAATAAGANAVIGLSVRGALSDLYGGGTADAIRVQYGGSVTPENAGEFSAQPDIDGALVGGASLKPDFVEIVKSARRQA